MNRKLRTFLIVTIISALIVTALAAGLLARGSGRSNTTDTTGTTGTTGKAEKRDPSASIAEGLLESKEIDQQERSARLDMSKRLSDPPYKTVIDLALSDGPGKPEKEPDWSGSALSATNGDRTSPPVPAPLTPASLALADLALSRSLIIVPTPTIAPTGFPHYADVTIYAPVAGQVLTAGDNFLVEWETASKRVLSYSILLSTNNGRSYQTLASKLIFMTDTGRRSHRITIPNTPSKTCLIRVEAYLNDAPFTSGTSPAFTIVARPTPIPTAKPTPLPTPKPSLTPTPTSAPTLEPSPTPSLAPLPVPTFSRSNSLFIDRNADATRWVAINLRTDSAKKIVWQVSKVPFVGFDSQTLSPPGLLAQGELDPGARSFAVDFGAIVSNVEYQKGAPQTVKSNQGAAFKTPDTAILMKQRQYSLYVRAVALDTAGRVIGDPGEGLQMTFGDAMISQAIDDVAKRLGFGPIEVWSAERSDYMYGIYQHRAKEGIIAHPDDSQWYLEFRSPPTGTADVLLQVTTSPFSNDKIEKPDGLVYELDFANGKTWPTWPMKHPLDLKAFVPPESEIGTSTIKYYVRMIFLVPSKTDPGVYDPVVSETQIVYYNNLELIGPDSLASTLRPTQKVQVQTHIPLTQFLRYVPVQWEDPNWKEYFEVTRRIMAEEMNFKITNNKVGETLMPYPFYAFAGMGLEQYNPYNPNMSKEEYQSKLDTWLPVGASFHLTIKESSSIWGDLWNLASSIYNSVRSAYDSLKNSIITGFVNLLPVSQDVKNVLNRAITMAVDAGLASLGIPPTLPDFTAIASEGIGYALDSAIAEACAYYDVLPEEITDELREQITGEIKKQMDELAKKSQVNPLNVDFLKPASSKIYRPAYVEVLVKNYSKGVSPAGTLKISYYAENSSFHSFYKPVNVVVPALQPDEFRIIKVFLKENIDIPVWQNKPPFDAHYWGTSGKSCRFTVSVAYNVPDAGVLAAQQGLAGKDTGFPIMQKEYVYDHNPVYSYSYVQLPCEYMLEEDPNVKLADFWKYEPK